MTDSVLDLLKFGLLALLYLFFARVLWAVWSEVRTPAAVRWAPGRGGGSGARTRETGAMHFVVVEPRILRGQKHVLSSTLTIGRDDACDIVVGDDAFISGRHARIEVRPDGAWLVDLRSTNGTFLNGTRIAEERLLRKGDRIQVGSTVLETRQ